MTSARRGVACAALVAFIITASSCAPDPPMAIVALSVDACDSGLEAGSGSLVAPGIVLTSAHVVAGAESIDVTQPGTGHRVAGTIVGFDPINDLAYVSFDGVGGVVGNALVEATRPAKAGDTGTAYVVRDGVVFGLPVTVSRPINIHTEDIYIDTMTDRPGFELVADIERGDSGGPVVVNGQVIGVIWARSNLAPSRAYAIDVLAGSSLIDRQLDTGTIGTDTAGATIDLARCY